MATHPTKDELSGFMLGKLAPQATEAVAEHVDQCPPCQETIHSLEGHQDTLLQSLRQPAPQAVVANAEMEKVIQNVAKLIAEGLIDGQDPDATQVSSVTMQPTEPSDVSIPSQPKVSGPTREQFVKTLLASGLIDAVEWMRLQAEIPAIANASDGASLARALIQRGALTKFQASVLYQGKSKGLVFGEYAVLDRLGAGGMGQVYKAQHRSMDRIVALKVLSKEAMKSPEAIKRFQREAKAAAKLIHPHIVTAFDAGQQEGVHFLVMEYVEGSDLSALLKARGRLPVEKATAYILQAARGLAFAHSKGVVHRDIKPANLLLDADGVVKILDMGLARIDGGVMQAAQEGLTQTGQVMGTVDYMAPEQAFDTRHADAQADVYSLGCTFFRLLTGHNLYSGETIVQKILAHRENPIPSLRDALPDIPPQVEAFYQRMVAKQPQKRPTMTEAIESLEAIQRLLIASPQTNTLADATGATAEVPQIVTDTQPSVLRSRASKPAVEHRDPPWRNRRTLIAAGAAGFVLLLLAVWVIVRDKEGKEVGRMQLPEGGNVSLEPDSGAATKKPAKSPSARGDKPADGLAITPTAVASSNPQSPITNPKWNTPAFQQWLKETQALPADKQLEAVSKKLMELNPGFDGKIDWPKFKDGVVAGLTIVTDNVTDITPLRALPGLTTLHCAGSAIGKGQLSDLSPLAGMKLTSLNCSFSKVTDLSPLRGMPLTYLFCGVSPLSDLSPLEGMPLEDLNCSSSAVADLSPLRGMPLKHLDCYGTRVSDLSPLRGMPLTSLSCATGRVIDVAPLAGMKLTEIGFSPKTVLHGMDALRGMKSLKNFGFFVGKEGRVSLPAEEFWKRYDAGEFRRPVANVNDPAFQRWVAETQKLSADKQLEAVGKKLMELNPGFDGQLTGLRGPTGIPGGGVPKVDKGMVTEVGLITDNVTDLSPLRALSGLSALHCTGGTGLKGSLINLSPLAGMPLTKLEIDANLALSDLSPLRGMKLTSFSANYTAVTELSLRQLQGMPLTYFHAGNAELADLSFLKGMPLEITYLNGSFSDLSPLRGMPLRHLSCRRSQVTDLSPLKGMPLSRLGMENSPLSDLSPLADLKNLKTLFVKKTQVTTADVATLQKALPDCKIEWDDPTKPAGHALEFDGIDDVVEIPSIGDNLGPPLTLEAWVAPDDIAAGQSTVIAVGADDGLRFKIKRLGSQWHALVGNETHRWAVAPLTPGRRVHVAGVFSDRNQVTLFVDGIAAPPVGLDPAIVKQRTAGRLRIGFARDDGNAPIPFAGIVDQVRVSNTARYAANFTPAAQLSADAATLALYRFDEGSGDVLHDSSGKNHHGKITGARWVAIPDNTAATKKLGYLDPSFDPWVKQTQTLPAAKQIEAVSKKLVELNPRFDGKLNGRSGAPPVIENGAVTLLALLPDFITDLSPLRVWTSLKVLEMRGTPGRGRLSDLSPLRGLQLTTFSMSYTKVTDLSPLVGMPLTWLNTDVRMTDLSLLKGMPLKTLYTGNSTLSDLSPLRGMPLESLHCWNSQVSDLSPLAECKNLKTLKVTKTRVTAATVAALQKTLPNCKIEWDGSAKPPP